MRSPRRGQIYRRKSDEVGKPRRVLVVSRTELNGGFYVVVAPFYGEQVEKRAKWPQCVHFQNGEFGLDKECVLKADEVTLLKFSDLRISEGPVGEVDESRMKDVSRALAYALGLDFSEPAEASASQIHVGRSQVIQR
jgi:mRNA-degrading endonuclease toxin of MazEF toxin-antitoxin module